jgi:3-deoxy-D-manno-octulosonic acid kinase
VSETQAPQDGRVAGSAEPLTAWHRAVEQLNVETCEAAELAFARGETAGAAQFLWQPLREFGKAALRRGGPGRLSRAVLAGYWSLARAAKLWEAEMHWGERHLDRLESGRLRGVVRREWRATAERVLSRHDGGEVIAGGRGGALRIPTEQGPVVLRRFRRGGAMRWLGDTYFGFRHRPLREFALLLRARRRGLAVPDPLAAVVERRFGFGYRGWLMMHEIVGATPLSDLVDGGMAIDVVGLLARGLRDLHDAGLSHPDLNLGNLLVVTRSYGSRLAFVDLDRARLCSRPLGTWARRRSLRRLRRSAAKLDPAGRLLSAAALDRLEQLYWQPPAARSGAEAIDGPPERR